MCFTPQIVVCASFAVFGVATVKSDGIDNFQCDGDLCFSKDYHKVLPPNSGDVYLYKPAKTYLRKVDVYEATITLDVLNTGM